MEARGGLLECGIDLLHSCRLAATFTTKSVVCSRNFTTFTT